MCLGYLATLLHVLNYWVDVFSFCFACNFRQLIPKEESSKKEMKLSLKLFRLFVQFLTWLAIVSYLHLYDGVLHFVIT